MITNKSLKPSNENILLTLKNNILNNNKFISSLLSFIPTVDDCSISIDAKWGNGKTFLAKQLIYLINLCNENTNANSIVGEYPNINISLDGSYSSYAIYYNAWEQDNDSNPMVSFLYFLIKSLNYKYENPVIIQAIDNLLFNVIGVVSQGIIRFDKSSKDSIGKVLSSVIDSELVKRNLRDLLQSLKKERCNQLVIFIDELDRCRPQYAIRFLEMMKSYMQVEGIVLICMTDMSALSKGINSVYGYSYEAYNYLDKIFDFRFEIPRYQAPETYILSRFNKKIGAMWYDIVLLNCIKKENLSLRQIDKIIAYLGDEIGNVRVELEYSFDAIFISFIYHTVKPIIIIMKLFNIEEYNKFCSYSFDYLISLFDNPETKKIIEHIYEKKLNSEAISIEKCLQHDLKIIADCLNGIDNLETLYCAQHSYNIRRIVDEFNLINYISGGKK